MFIIQEPIALTDSIKHQKAQKIILADYCEFPGLS